MTEEKKKLGRPSKFTKLMGQQICEYISEGLTLRQIQNLPGMPNKSQIMAWQYREEPHFKIFQEQYDRALAIRAELWAEEIIDITDDGSNDWMIREGKDGEEQEVINHEHIQRSRLRVDARKWLLSKALPKKYGEKVQQEVTGANGADLFAVLEIAKSNESKD